MVLKLLIKEIVFYVGIKCLIIGNVWGYDVRIVMEYLLFIIWLKVREDIIKFLWYIVCF